MLASTDLPRSTAIKSALEIFSDPWSFAVLEELFFGIRRFDDFQSKLNISRSVLTRRLRHLEEKHIIERQLYSERPKRFEYRLTDSGKDMYPIFITLQQWGQRWLDSSPSGLKLTHKTCQNKLDLDVVCKHCSEKVHASDVEYDLAE